jgi:hypothetical protein
MGGLDCKANISSFAHFQVTISNGSMPALRSIYLDDAIPTTPSTLATTNQQQQYHHYGSVAEND